MIKKISFLSLLFIMASCNNKQSKPESLSSKIQTNEYFKFTKEKALNVVKSGFSAGDGYDEVWIRDFNTFINLSAEVFEPKVLKEKVIKIR